MPIYAYKCGSCGLSKDVLQKISDDPLTVCPACSQATFQKQLTAAGFQLKGSGWYATDFKGGSTSAPATESKTDSASPSTGADSKSGDSAASTPAKTDASPAASGGACGTGCACH